MTSIETTKAPYRVRLTRSILSPVFLRQHKRDAKMLNLPLVTKEDGLHLQGVLIGRGVRVMTSAWGKSERVYFAQTREEAEAIAARTATAEETIWIGTLRGKVYREN